MANFADFINKKYVEWQAQNGKRKTLEEFSAYLGISRPLLSMWMNGVHRPGNENMKLLVEIFGLEVYDALDLPRPDPDLYHVQAHWVGLPPEAKKKIRDIVEKYSIKE